MTTADKQATRWARRCAEERGILLENFGTLASSDSDIGPEWIAYDRRDRRMACSVFRPWMPDNHLLEGQLRGSFGGHIYIVTFYGLRPPSDRPAVYTEVVPVELGGGKWQLEPAGDGPLGKVFDTREDAIGETR